MAWVGGWKEVVGVERLLTWAVGASWMSAAMVRRMIHAWQW
jgi:hypothetical protein